MDDQINDTTKIYILDHKKQKTKNKNAQID